MSSTTIANNGRSDAEALALLRESATPDLYHRNGFRILEIPVDATARDVSRRKQMVEMAATNGVSLPPGPGRCFPLDPPPDEFAVRDAVQRLGDPERRLVDEFFWFWPHEQGQSRSDQALQALAKGEHERASAIWNQQENNQSVSLVSTHNLAILHHLLALQWEDYAQVEGVGTDDRQNIEELWSRAFRRWQRLLDEEAFWSRLTSRIREFEDPRLTAGTAKRLRTALPAALLAINARLALQAVEQGKKDSATRLVEVIEKSGFPHEAIKEGLRQAVEPIRSRIKALCRAAEQSAETDPIRGDKACRQLLDSSLPLLEGLDCLLAAGDPTREVAHDDVAEQALRCQVAFAKKTNNWETSAELLAIAESVASSESVRKRIQENLKTVQNNAENNDDFCGEGYYELPPAHLEQMEIARGQAEAGEFDQAIATLESLPRPDLMACPLCRRGLGWAHKTVGEELSCPFCKGVFPAPAAPELFPADGLHSLDKAMAYCLGFRGIRRLNQSAQSNDEIPPTLMRAMALSQMGLGGSLLGGGMSFCMACASHLDGQYYTMEFRGVKVHVCLSCHSKIKSEDEARKSRIRDAVRKSAEDFVRAGQLDPANRFVQKQINQVREICSNVGLSLPKPPKARKPKASQHAVAQPISEAVTPAASTGVCSSANWSIGLALAGVLCGLAAIPAVVCGHRALNDIDASGGALSGRGRAVTGLVLGYITITLQVILILAALTAK